MGNAMPEKYVPPRIEIHYTWGLSDKILEKIPELRIRFEGNCACSCQCSCSCMCSCLIDKQLEAQIFDILKQSSDSNTETEAPLKYETPILELHYSSDMSEKELEKIQSDSRCLCACSCMCDIAMFERVVRIAQKAKKPQQEG